MIRYIQIATLLVAAEASVLCAAPKEPAKVVRPAQPPRPPAPPKGAAKVNNPGASVAQRLMRMTPEQRERALEKLPPQQQAQIRQRLERLDNLPPQQRERVIQQYQEFQSLSPEKQNLVTRQIQAINHLPDDRGPVVRAELQRLRRMPENEREARMASEEFKGKFTPAEQQMLSDISTNLPQPTPPETRR
jgi:hypothetical protein